MSTSPRPRGLRIGVVLGDTIVAEHQLDRGGFSIGRRSSATVSLPLPGLPARWDLLTVDEHGARLRLGPGMDLRLADATGVRTRADVAPEPASATCEVVIPKDGRGKVIVGDVTVMFQELALAPRAPAPRLPRELRASLADRLDRRLVAFAAASLAVHVGVMVAARLNDPPAERTVAEQVMDDFVEPATVIDAADLAYLDPPPKAPTPGTATTMTKVEPQRPNQPQPTRPSRPTTTTPATTDAAGDAARVADALFSSDDGGLIAGDAARRRPGGDLATQLDELRHQQATASIGDGSDRELPRTDGPQLGTSQEPTTTLPDQVVTAPRPKVEPDRGRVAITGTPKRAPGDPSVDGVLGKIKTTYMAGLVRCYKKAMADSGPLSGKLVLAFEVTERGGVSGATASGVDPAIEQCVLGLMSGWRFTPVVDEDGDATDVDVKLTLALQPT